MTMRGRRPNPENIPQREANDSESVGGTGALPEPVWRMIPPTEWEAAAVHIAGETWREIEPEMRALGTLGAENAGTLEMLCVQYARWRVAEAQVARLGPVIKAPKTGVPMQNPFLSIANQAGDRYLRLAAELGLTPAMRGRVGKRPMKKAGAVKPLDL